MALASSGVMPFRNPKAVCCLSLAGWARTTAGASTASTSSHATVDSTL